MKENNWYTFSEGSKKLGKSHSYLYKSMKDRPELFKSTMIQKQGRIWLISDEGLNYIKKNTKKEGDRLRTAILKAVYKAKSPFAFTLLILTFFKCY